jgi:hypothetical protein
MTKLFKPDPALAYQVEFFPWSALGCRGKDAIVWHKSQVMTKMELTEQLTDDMTQIYFKDQSLFRVVWEHNHTPTLSQWNKVKADALVRVQFRISPIIETNSRVAILSLLNVELSEIRTHLS